jgi:hypothetical protein
MIYKEWHCKKLNSRYWCSKNPHAGVMNNLKVGDQCAVNTCVEN